MRGKLFIIEGLDGSGKETQTKRLYNRLKEEKINIKKVEYPNYKSDSSALIKMYLNGEFGNNVEDVDAYVSSTFYAVDRYASYKTEWEDFYLNGGVVLADRYTSSNMIHQASKIDGNEERDKYLQWLDEFEFDMYGLPRPTKVIFINMPPEYSKQLIANRDNKITGETKKDIHESNFEYLKKSYDNALNIAKTYNWTIIDCVKDGKLLTIDQIHDMIYMEIKKELDKNI
ncbi:MAG: deoxynucleoside kinase [Epulopiscium sp.]|nr:deoxynucleoside kinase [Candidatus Epulonipiscium sp.]